MNLTEYKPTSQLKPFIKSYRIIESEEGQVNRVLPNTSFALAFCVKGQVSYVSGKGEFILPAITFSGTRKSVRLIKYAPQTKMIIVLFNETGVSAFFNKGIHELYEQSVSLNNYFSESEISETEEQLQLTQDNTRRIGIIEQFLISKCTPNKTDSLVLDAITKINSAKGNIRIKELANELYISQDAFEKRFRRVTGSTPKQFSHIVKMNSAIWQRHTLPSFMDMAYQNGYYDQSHFNKDFKIFTGQTPGDFFDSAMYW